jgi:hypothetical protein
MESLELYSRELPLFVGRQRVPTETTVFQLRTRGLLDCKEITTPPFFYLPRFVGVVSHGAETVPSPHPRVNTTSGPLVRFLKEGDGVVWRVVAQPLSGLEPLCTAESRLGITGT